MEGQLSQGRAADGASVLDSRGKVDSGRRQLGDGLAGGGIEQRPTVARGPVPVTRHIALHPVHDGSSI